MLGYQKLDSLIEVKRMGGGSTEDGRTEIIYPTAAEKAINNIAIAGNNQATAILDSANIFGNIFSKTMQEVGSKIANKLGNIADEMRRTRLTQEYFSLMNNISQCAAVLDETTVRTYLEKLQNIETKKMTEQEILFLMLNFPNKELCGEIQKMALAKGISAYEVGKEFLKSAVIVEKIWLEEGSTHVLEDNVDYEVTDWIPFANFYFAILINGDLRCGSQLYFSSDFLSSRTKNCPYWKVKNFEIEDFEQGKLTCNGENEPSRKLWNRIYYINTGLESKIQEEYLELWNQNSKYLKKEQYTKWQIDYCEWENFEKEVEIDNMLKMLRTICFEMQMAASLARFNQK